MLSGSMWMVWIKLGKSSGVGGGADTVEKTGQQMSLAGAGRNKQTSH